MKSSAAAGYRDNCFDVLRLILAGLVVYSHSYALGGFGDEPFLRLARNQTIAGSMGVLGFFGLSGFLISDSYIRKPDWLRFLRRRLLRIMPGYWCCLVLTAFLFAPAMFYIQRGQLAGYPWTDNDGAFSYVTSNALLRIHQPGISDAMVQLPHSGSINGSLWSLFPEFCCYLMLLFSGGCGLMSGGRIFLMAFVGLLTAFHILATAGSLSMPANTLPTLVTFTNLTPYVLAFFVGVTCRVFIGHMPLGGRGAVFFGIVTLVVLKFGGYQLASPWLIPLFFLNLGHAYALRLKHDFSYGLYIYGFPCQQLLALVPVLRDSVMVFFAASLALSLALAAASWFGIERRFLTRAQD